MDCAERGRSLAHQLQANMNAVIVKRDVLGHQDLQELTSVREKNAYSSISPRGEFGRGGNASDII